MKLTSSAFDNNGRIPAKYTCDGENINPPLFISNVPTNAKSLVLIIEDQDVPRKFRADGMWDHWIIFNIPPDTTEILEGESPAGVNGMGTGGKTNYDGPCPPDKEHRYFFKLYALDTILDLPEKSNKHEIENAMESHILAKTELIGLYG